MRRLDPGIDDIPLPLSGAQRNARYKKQVRAHRPAVKIAVLDLETDPFDHENQSSIYPFLAVLYSEHIDEPVVIWDEDWQRLMTQVADVILRLPDRYIIYAHNGGRFDFLFLLKELRGQVLFKGRALMSAKIGNHEIRDSLHIIPETLKNANRKTEIDYQLFTKGKRNAHRRAIIDYCIDDCRSLYEVVAAFKDEFGTPITIGQAAMARLKTHYEFDRLSEASDGYFRQWFFGGRVECLHTGIIRPTDLRLYDVNSMYPNVMANYEHPVSRNYHITDRIQDNSVFITLSCTNNRAFICRSDNGSLTTKVKHGTFNTTKWEYEVALKHGLIRDIEIHRCISFERSIDFSAFISPLYRGRQQSKELQRAAEQAGDVVAARNYARDVLFRKLLMNNAYGKFAQNPRRFKVHEITDPLERPDEWYGDTGGSIWGELPNVETDMYWIWSKPADEFRFNNVATAASITGAARACLLDVLVTSISPVYCDTDSIICETLADNVHVDALALGAWDCETNIDAFIGNGKKLYAYHKPETDHDRHSDPHYHCPVCLSNHSGIVVKAKGMNGVTWEDMVQIANGNVLKKRMRAPLISKDGTQVYIERELRRTNDSLFLAA